MTLRLRADTRAPAAARAFVEEAVADRPVPAAVLEEVVLIASELVTNAVKSGATHVEIDLTWSREQLLLVVDDDGAGWPTMLAADEDAVSGRGLAIVDHLADSWKVVPRATGKRVLAARSLAERRGS